MSLGQGLASRSPTLKVEASSCPVPAKPMGLGRHLNSVGLDSLVWINFISASLVLHQRVLRLCFLLLTRKFIDKSVDDVARLPALSHKRRVLSQDLTQEDETNVMARATLEMRNVQLVAWTMSVFRGCWGYESYTYILQDAIDDAAHSLILANVKLEISRSVTHADGGGDLVTGVDNGLALLLSSPLLLALILGHVLGGCQISLGLSEGCIILGSESDVGRVRDDVNRQLVVVSKRIVCAVGQIAGGQGDVRGIKDALGGGKGNSGVVLVKIDIGVGVAILLNFELAATGGIGSPEDFEGGLQGLPDLLTTADSGVEESSALTVEGNG